jgi:hypothetical protein
MAINYYDKGDVVRLYAYCTISGSYADPTELTLKTKQPDGTISTYLYSLTQIDKDSVGHYHKDVEMTQAGQFWYRYEGTGALVSAEETYLIVRPSEFD